MAQRERDHYDQWQEYYEAMEKAGRNGRSLERNSDYDQWKAARTIQGQARNFLNRRRTRKKSQQ